MAQTTRRTWSDSELLTALDLYENEGLPCSAIAERMAASKNAIVGVIDRIRRADKPDDCLRPENRDGGMLRLWWVRA